MKWLVVALLVASGAAWITAGYWGLVRSDRIRESREHRQASPHGDAGAITSRPPLESQSTRLAATDPTVGGW